MVETQKKVEELKKTYLSWSLHDSDVRREGIQQGRKEGIAIGEARGEKRGEERAKLENARNLLVMNVLSHEQIAQAVGLPLKTIEELAQNS